MLDVVGAIDDLPPAPGVRNVAGKGFMLQLRIGAIGVGRDAGRPGEATCVKLALLEKTASSGLARYLTAAQAGTIAPAIQVAEQQFSC